MEARLATLSLTVLEALAVRDYVRQHNEYGRVWNRQDMLAVHAAVLYLTDHPEETYDLAMDTDTLWLLEQQIPPALKVGPVEVGRHLLLKVMTALAELTVGPEDHDDDEPTAEALPGYIEQWETERAAAEKGFEQWLS